MPRARQDRTRCTKCLKEGIRTHPDPISVSSTGYNEYVTMKCKRCGHVYKTTSKSAYRIAVSIGLAKYGN